jgi:hypothetical protein
LRNRRDICRRFAQGCGLGEVLTISAAENSAVNHALLDLNSPAGMCLPSLSAEFAGISLARSLRENPDAIFKRFRNRVSVSDIIPNISGLRDGFGQDKFDSDFGGPNDVRFQAVLVEIRRRIRSLPVGTIEP